MEVDDKVYYHHTHPGIPDPSPKYEPLFLDFLIVNFQVETPMCGAFVIQGSSSNLEVDDKVFREPIKDRWL